MNQPSCTQRMSAVTAGKQVKADNMPLHSQPCKRNSAAPQTAPVNDLSESKPSHGTSRAAGASLGQIASEATGTARTSMQGQSCSRTSVTQMPVNSGPSLHRSDLDSHRKAAHVVGKTNSGQRHVAQGSALQTSKLANPACPKCTEPEFGFMPACKTCHIKYHAGCLGDQLTGATANCTTLHQDDLSNICAGDLWCFRMRKCGAVSHWS